jgi:hypothetical protein
MSRFLQELESRTLFAADYAADQAQIVADAAAARDALKSASLQIAAGVKVIATDLRAGRTPANQAANAGLLRTLKSHVASARATLRADTMHLLGAGTALSRRVAASAQRLTLDPGNPLILAKLAADVPALQMVIQTRMDQLQTDLQNISLDTDVAAIVAANPANTDLATHADAAQTSGSAAVNAFVGAATTFATDVAGLITDVDQLPKTPNIVGNYNGVGVTTAGEGIGHKVSLAVHITGEADDGSLTGMVTVTQAGEPANMLTLTGSVTEDGTFSATLDDPSGMNGGATLAGNVVGKTISGTYVGSADSGTFSIKRP